VDTLRLQEYMKNPDKKNDFGFLEDILFANLPEYRHLIIHCAIPSTIFQAYFLRSSNHFPGMHPKTCYSHFFEHLRLQSVWHYRSKIEDESLYEDLTISSCNSNALQKGNSYIEHLLIVEILEELRCLNL
jgi:hypothetical protein